MGQAPDTAASWGLPESLNVSLFVEGHSGQNLGHNLPLWSYGPWRERASPARSAPRSCCRGGLLSQCMPCSPPSHEGRCDGPHPCPWSRLAAGAGHQTWRCATAPRLVPAPVPAASPLDPLRLCCPLWAWSMWDGVGNLHADAVALRALSWGLLSWHWHLSLPALLCSPLRRLCRPTMPHIVKMSRGGPPRYP